MRNFSIKFSFAFLFLLGLFACADAQILPDASSPDGRSASANQKDLPDGIKESLAKQRIASEEKEYRELVEKGEEAAQLSSELNKSLENNRKLSSEDLKKLDRLEKLVKKIRSDLGAKDDDSEDAKSVKTSLVTAGKNLQETTSDLLSEIKKIGRHTISVVAIESSNSLLRLVQFLRFNKK